MRPVVVVDDRLEERGFSLPLVIQWDVILIGLDLLELFPSGSEWWMTDESCRSLSRFMYIHSEARPYADLPQLLYSPSNSRDLPDDLQTISSSIELLPYSPSRLIILIVDIKTKFDWGTHPSHYPSNFVLKFHFRLAEISRISRWIYWNLIRYLTYWSWRSSSNPPSNPIEFQDRLETTVYDHHTQILIIELLISNSVFIPTAPWEFDFKN